LIREGGEQQAIQDEWGTMHR